MRQLMLPKKPACAFLGVITTTLEGHRHGCHRATRSRGETSVCSCDFPLPPLRKTGTAETDAYSSGPRYRFQRASDLGINPVADSELVRLPIPPLTQERERALLAIEKARAGETVALISSGDIGIYAMAALAFEEMREDDTYAVNVVPGITAANACASLLGSPLSHDFATLSLSNLMCPWEWIEHRARHIAAADLACVLYNVQSNARVEGVYRILEILLEHKSPETLCGVIRNAYRPEQAVAIHRLGELSALRFDMLTTIVVGNRFTRRKREWIFTPRGYNDWVGDEDAQGRSANATATATGIATAGFGPASATGIATAAVGPASATGIAAAACGPMSRMR